MVVREIHLPTPPASPPLDVDLTLDSLRHPERYPLVAKK